MSQAPSKEMRLAVEGNVHRNIKRIASHRGTSMESIVNTVLAQWAEAQPEHQLFEQLGTTRFDPTAARRQHPIPEKV